MDPHFNKYNGPPLPNEMDLPYIQDNGAFPHHALERSYGQEYDNSTMSEIDPRYLQDYEVDQAYRQEYGPSDINETAASYRQDYGPPLQTEVNQPYGQNYSGSSQLDEMTYPYWQENGPPLLNETETLDWRNYYPQNNIPPHRADYTPQSSEMGSMYRQDYLPANETDLHYRQYHEYLPTDETEPQFIPHHAPPQFGQQANTSSQPMDVRNHYPPYFNTAKERSNSTGSKHKDKHSSPQHTVEEALREIEVNLPRLTVLPSTRPPQPKGEECGIPNLGQTCYLSAVLQCLYHTKPLTNYLISKTYKDDIVKESPFKGQVARAAADILTEMDRGKPKKGTVAYFKGVCGRMDDIFAGSGHREAYDLLSTLLIWLHRDLANGEPVCACTKNSIKRQHKDKQLKPNDGISDQIRDSHGDQHNPSSYNIRNQPQPTSQNHPRSNYKQPPLTTNYRTSSMPKNICKKCGLEPERRSVISDIFEGMHRATIICPESGVIIRSIHERFWSLSLPLDYSGELPIEDALEQFYRTTAVNWYCNYCGREHLCHHQMRILFLPRVLILHLNRYTIKRIDPKDIQVTFPTEDLTLDDYLTPGLRARPRNKFSLYSICNHKGNKKQGHNTACCRSNHPQKVQTDWVFFDDDEVWAIERFKNPREAHILFYTGNEDH